MKLSPLHSPLANRSNPFCTRFVRPGEIEYRFSSTETESTQAVLDRLQAERVGLVVGPHGSGKSTLVHTLVKAGRGRFSEHEVVQLVKSDSKSWIERLSHSRAQGRQVGNIQHQLPPGALFVVDGAEQLSSRIRRRILRLARIKQHTVLATSHQPLDHLPVLYRTTLNPRIVRELAEQLTHDCSPEVKALAKRRLEQVDWGTLTNVRELWFQLYDEVHSSIQLNRQFASELESPHHSGASWQPG